MAVYRPVSTEPAETAGLITNSPCAGKRVCRAREEKRRSGSSHMVGTIGMPTDSSSRR